MHKKILKTVLTIAAIMPFSIALAEQNRPVLDAMKAKIASTTARMEERMEDRRDQRRDTLLSIAKIKISRMIRRFEATIERAGKISNRISTRIQKVKANGGDTSKAEGFITEANMHIEQAKTALVTLKGATSSPDLLVDANATTSKIIKTGMMRLRNMAKNVETHIREAHKSLTNALRALKGMSSANATSTPNQN